MKENKVYCQKGDEISLLSTPVLKEDRLVFVNNRVDGKIVDNLRQKGFRVIDDSEEGNLTWPDALIKCLQGKITACIFHTPQIRDVLLGLVLGKITKGCAIDWNGNNIILPNGGRIPRILFGFEDIPEEIMSCLKNS